MRRTGAVVLLVGILIVTAGCNGLLGSNDAPPQVTPAPLPTTDPKPQLPPQRTPCAPEGNISAFVATASAPNLANTSYTFRLLRTEIYQNGSLRSHRSFTGEFATNLSRIHLSETTIGSAANLSGVQDYLQVNILPAHRRPSRQPIHREIWTNSTHVASRTTSGQFAHYYAGSAPFESGHINGAMTPVREGMFGVLQGMENENASVTDRFTRNGTTFCRIRFTAPIVPVGSGNATVRQNATASALIDSHGIIHELRYNYTIRTAAGAVVTVTERLSITAIGSTSADRPIWYPEAVNRTTPVPVTSPTATGTPTD